MPPSPAPGYVCYTLVDLARKYTYVGITNNLGRRIRQHNGELAGGARYTKGRGKWCVAWTVRGFHRKEHALMFEWAVKRAQRSSVADPLLRRANALVALSRKERWTARAPVARSVRLAVHVHLPVACPDSARERLGDLPDHFDVVLGDGEAQDPRASSATGAELTAAEAGQ